MGNTHAKPHPRPRNKKQVHWKAADRPSVPGKPHLSSDNDLTPDLVTIVWSKPSRDGGSPITGYLVEHRRTGSPHWVRATPLLVQIPELTISGLEPGWRYQFRVRAENAVGLSDCSESSEPLTVTLQKFAITAPKFTEELKDATALENDKVEFLVHFLGQPMPKICWFKDGFEIFSSRRTRIITENNKSVLTIHQSALADEGEIKCTATNKAGHASTKSKLSLEAPPSIRLPRQYEDGLLFEIGEVLRLKVSVAGRPTPLVFWSHDGETIQNNDRYEIEYIDKCSILKVGEALRSDRGEYQIKAVNKIGEDVVSFLVTITDKPSPPGKARVVMTLGKSVTLSWGTPSDDGGCKIGNYIIEYYRLGWNVWLKAATSRQLSTILGDLIEGSEYKFRVKAESPYGVSDPSEESDVVFIPDAKRGITSPQARSRSQPKDFIDEIAAPIAARRTKSRSQSSSGKAENINDLYDPPKRPERTKIKSPPKTPELSRKDVNPIRQIDRASFAREMAYGSPDINVSGSPTPNSKINQNSLGSNSVVPVSRSPSPSKPLEQKMGQPDATQTPREVSKTPSPKLMKASNQKEVSRTPSPKEPRKTPSPKAKPKMLRETFDESSEFMLVLYPETHHKDHREDVEFDFSDYDIPPPISLSAPELGAAPPLFENLRNSASSTELLHERAMIRFNEAAAAEEEYNKRRRFSYDGQRNIEIPKIQINSKDDQEIVGLERKSSRRKSAGSIVQQQLLWAHRRFSLKNSNDFGELESKWQKSKREQNMTDAVSTKKEIIRQRSESEEKEEEEFEKIRSKMTIRGQSSFEKRSIEVVDEDKWLEEYEESLSESETESSEDERDFDEKPSRRIYSDEDDDTYHPGFTRETKKPSDEPFEILTKRNKLPDPNFVPKPILKKTDDKPELFVELPKENPVVVKTRSHSPMPQEMTPRGRSKSLAQPTDLPRPPNKSFQRSISLSTNEDIEPPQTNLVPSAAPGQNISVAATLGGLTAASIVIPEELLKKRKAEEEAKVVVDHYTDIVKNYGQRRKASLKTVEEEKTPKQTTNVFQYPQQIQADPQSSPKPKPNQHFWQTEDDKKLVENQTVQPREAKEFTRIDKTSNVNQTVQKIVTRDRSVSPTPPPQKASPTQPRGRSINHKPRRGSARSQTPSKSPSRLENWSGRKSSPSPIKARNTVRRTPSPIPLAKPRPRLREIMTQTSIGLELNYSSDSRTSTPNDRRHEELLAKAEVKVRSFFDYVTDLAMFIVACWLYLFSNELLAIPVLLVMVYRQLKNEVRKRMPRWILRRFVAKKSKRI